MARTDQGIGIAAEAAAVRRTTEATHAAEAGRTGVRAAAECAAQTSTHPAQALGLRRRATNQPCDDGRAYNQLIRFHVRISR
jgi:hypothetical protein